MAGRTGPTPLRSRGRSAGPARTARKKRKRPRQEVRRALLSVYDKEGVVELARGLSELGIEILSTGGTARMLIDNDVPVVRIADYTRFPEMLDGRVKTLHPKIHAGIMAVRGNRKHMAQLRRVNIPSIDLVVVNLYPFEKTAAMEGIGFDEIVEMIDIGGPTLLRAAAKNFRHVGVVVDPADYAEVLSVLQAEGKLTEEFRFDMAKRAFQHVAAYDTAIYSHLSMLKPDGQLLSKSRESAFPPRMSMDLLKAQDLRYGENPHQRAAFYRDLTGNTPSVSSAQQLHGKELSFNNILDLDAAFRLACDFKRPACAAIKHMNPCGVGIGRSASEAFARARDADPVSIFGGIVGFNVEVGVDAAREMSELFLEAIIAPGYSPEALDILRSKKNLRLLRTASASRSAPGGMDLRRVSGGLLIQEWDGGEPASTWRIVTRKKPTADQRRAMEFAWKVVRHVRSNAIVYATKDRTVGIGAGQMSRIDSVRLGAMKATAPLEDTVLASDAFFPFRDGVDAAAESKVSAIVQPGGSVRDKEVIAAADEHGIAMAFTGFRHFRH